MRRPQVSVVIPAYNAAETLPETLDSLLAQTFHDWEAIVVDDGSTDATYRIACGFSGKDSRVRPVQQTQHGEGGARNAGMRLARAEWLLFLDSDDWLGEEALARFFKIARANENADGVCCASVRVTPAGERVNQAAPRINELFTHLAQGCAFAVHSCMIRRSLANSVGGFEPSLKTCADWDFWQRIARTGAQFKATNEVLAYYRMRPNSAGTAPYRLLEDGLSVIERGHTRDPRVPDCPPHHAVGRPKCLMEAAKLSYVAYPAGMLVGLGREASGLLESVKSCRAPGLATHAVACNLYQGVFIAKCEHPTNWPQWWPELEAPIRRFLKDLEQVSTAPGFADQAAAELEHMILEYSPFSRRPMKIGSTFGIRYDLSDAPRDLTLPEGIKTVHCTVERSGDYLGTSSFPARQGVVPSAEIEQRIQGDLRN